MSTFKVGDEVTVAKRLWEPADENYPGTMLALPGDRLIVRAVRKTGKWCISVSHHNRTDGMTFAVAPDELLTLPADSQGGEEQKNMNIPNVSATQNKLIATMFGNDETH